MIDFKSMSDEQLDAMLAGESTPTPPVDYSGMSDAELDSILSGVPQVSDASFAMDTTQQPLDMKRDFEGDPEAMRVAKEQAFYETPEGQAQLQKEMEESYSYTEQMEKAGQQVAGVARGAARLPLGVGLGIETLTNKLSDTEYSLVSDWIKGNENYIKEHGLEGQALIGEISTNVLGGYLSGATKAVTVAGVEAGLEYTARKGAGAENVDAIYGAVMAGGIAGGVTKIINSLGATKSQELYDYMKNMNNVPEDEANRIFTNWSKVMKAEDTLENRIKSMVDSFGYKGKEIKQEAAKGSPLATREIEGEMKARQQIPLDLTKGAADVKVTAQQIKDASKIVKDNYGLVKKKVTNKSIDTKFDRLPTAVDEATTGTVTEIKKLLDTTEGKVLTTEDLVDSIPLINKMLRRAEGKTLKAWSATKNIVDKQLKKNLSETDYNLWKQANSEYSQMSNITKSKIGKVIARTLGKTKKGEKLTPGAAMEEISRMKPADDLFTDLQFLIGKGQTTAFEKSIIREAIRGTDDVNWANLNKNLRRKGFVSEEGKNIQNVIDDMSNSFATDDILQSIGFKQQGIQAGMSDDILSKIRFSLIGRVFTGMLKHIPFSETSKHMRMMDDLADVLKSPTKVKQLQVKMNEIGEGVRRQVLEDTVKDVLKQIEHKPGMVPSADISDVKPLYATERGTVGTSTSQITLHDRQKDLVQKALGYNIESERVVARVQEVMESNRLNSIVNNTRNRLETIEFKNHAKIIAGIVKSESSKLVKEIEQSIGIKLPSKEAEKILKLKFDESMKDIINP